ncbi:MAG: phosphoadenosine phosphosulfate reductase family protein [Firmicutes bacterium]|nr:phosphoadenosine phosphosulfate reductase family protein [Bacillota bacterium]
MDKEKAAIERLKTAGEMSLATYQKPLIITYSGGKDSDLLLELALRSGIDFELDHSLTTADAPQTVRHVKQMFKDMEEKGIKCHIDYPKMSMWQLIPYKCIPPTRVIRYCCRELKESNCKHRMIATGVRWAESVKRRKTRGIYEDTHSNRDKKIVLMNDNDDKRKLFERCQIQAKTIVNPIIDFTDDEVLDFYKNECKYHNPLYDMGFHRVGCIGCPMASKHRIFEFEVFPKYKEMYIRAFGRMLERRKEKGLESNIEWNTAQDVFDWWING